MNDDKTTNDVTADVDTTIGRLTVNGRKLDAAEAEVARLAILADRAARTDPNTKTGEAHRKLSSELDFIRGIARGVTEDVDRFEKAWPKSKRGSVLEKIFFSIGERGKTLQECAQDALDALAVVEGRTTNKS